MVLYCCLPECRQEYVKGGPSFHSFPRDKQRRSQWIKILSRNDYEPNTKGKICSTHFTEDCIITEKSGRRILTPFALPTINVFPTQHPATTKQRIIPDTYGETENEMEYTPHKVNNMINSEKVVIFSTADSSESKEAMEVLLGLEKSVSNIKVDEFDDGEYILDYLAQLTGNRQVPKIFINRAHFGGMNDIRPLFEEGILEKILASLKQ